MFITFEGVEGSGKTTQITRAAEALIAAGHSVVTTKEPGGTAIGTRLRQMILDTETRFKNPYTEVLLFYADRLEHVSDVILPAVKAGKVVLCDRYIDSTYAYQIGGRHMPEDIVTTLNTWVGTMPDLTLLFDLDPQVGIDRIQTRAQLDRFETLDMAFHHRVRQGYLTQAQKHPERIYVIEMKDRSVDDIFEEVKRVILQKLA